MQYGRQIRKITYVEATITVDQAWEDRGFAFGTAVINGTSTTVYVARLRRAFREKNGEWYLTEPRTPAEGDVLFALISTDVNDRSKKPKASFWRELDPTQPGRSINCDPCYRCNRTPCKCPTKH